MADETLIIPPGVVIPPHLTGKLTQREVAALARKLQGPGKRNRKPRADFARTRRVRELLKLRKKIFEEDPALAARITMQISELEGLLNSKSVEQQGISFSVKFELPPNGTPDIVNSLFAPLVHKVQGEKEIPPPPAPGSTTAEGSMPIESTAPPSPSASA